MNAQMLKLDAELKEATTSRDELIKQKVCFVTAI